MKAGPIVVGNIFQNRIRLCVPIYQRHYVWDRKRQWEPFWNDIRTIAIESLSGQERRFAHYMGALVLEPRGNYSAKAVPTFQVVDGQQRLMTFQIFLAAVRDYALTVGDEKTAEKINDYIINDKPHLMENAEVEIFKVWPTKYDREMFSDIILKDRAYLREKYAKYFYAKRDKIYEYNYVPKVLSAYGFFYDKIRHAVESDDLDDKFAIEFNGKDDQEEELVQEAYNDKKLDALWRTLLEEFKIVEIVLQDGDDAQIIFETLNERGEPLLAADLIRNNIFYRADGAGEDAEALFATHWTHFEDGFWSQEERQGRYRKPRIEFFLANFIAGQIAGDVNLTKIFSEYKSFLAPKRKNSSPRYSTVAQELETLSAYGKIYRELIERSSSSALSVFARRLAPWDVTTLYPLVLRIWHSSMPEPEKEACFNLLLSFIVRRAVCKLTPKNYNRFFLVVVGQLDEVGWGYNQLADYLTSQTTDTGRLPKDDEFAQSWLNSPVYLFLKPSEKVRAILHELETEKRTKFNETTTVSFDLTVEHILPETWRNEHWPLQDGTVPTIEQFFQWGYPGGEDDSVIGQVIRRERLKNTIGNLTLLTQPLNSSVSNGPYVQKRAALQEHSLLALNRKIAAHEKWDEGTIVERGQRLLSLALNIWPYPTSQDCEPKGDI